MIRMRLFLQLVALTFAVLIFYINWASSHAAVEIHDRAEDAVSQQKLVRKESRKVLQKSQDPSSADVEIHDGAEDALSQQKLAGKDSRNVHQKSQDPGTSSADVDNEINHGLDLKMKHTATTPVSHKDEIHNMREAKLMIRELQAKLMELDKRLPKKFPDVNFRLLDRKRILVPKIH
jgi:hypothetical protein